jgi:hypothetical protein
MKLLLILLSLEAVILGIGIVIRHHYGYNYPPLYSPEPNPNKWPVLKGER